MERADIGDLPVGQPHYRKDPPALVKTDHLSGCWAAWDGVPRLQRITAGIRSPLTNARTRSTTLSGDQCAVSRWKSGFLTRDQRIQIDHTPSHFTPRTMLS